MRNRTTVIYSPDGLTKICTKCHIAKTLDKFHKHRIYKGVLKLLCRCTECDNKIRLEWHKNNKQHVNDGRREWMRLFQRTPEEKLKAKTRRKTREAVLKGLIIKGNCEVCGSSKVNAHHQDYSKPLVVQWLCPKHHYEIHQKQ